jgi:two-component sensor histidine kinase
MSESLKLVSVTDNTPALQARSSRRRQVVALCMFAWTVFVALALWWLLRGGSGPAVYVIHDGAPRPQATFEKFRAWSRADLGIERVYPWVLLGPYVALIALCFPLERGRLRLSLALNLASCVGFVATSHAISARTSIKGATVLFITSQTRIETRGDRAATNSPAMGPVPGGAGQTVVLSETRAPKKIENLQDLISPVPDMVAERLRNFSDVGLSNVLVQARAGIHPGLPPPELPRLGLLSMLLDLLAYCAVIGLAHSVHFYRRFREREHRALFLESNLAHARLQALRAQLQPHFLFNSLNAIAALLRRDARLAEATLLSLSELLRLALSQSERQEVSLREEMTFVQHYLEIQQVRFGDKLRIEQAIDPAALDCLVPALLLQPVIENAIRHGIEPADNNGLVRVTAHRTSARLVMTVEDDGVGLPDHATGMADTSGELGKTAALAGAASSRRGIASARNGTGIGLTNLRARLETLYGTQQRVELAPRQNGGVVVRIEIPCRPATALEPFSGSTPS